MCRLLWRERSLIYSADAKLSNVSVIYDIRYYTVDYRCDTVVQRIWLNDFEAVLAKRDGITLIDVLDKGWQLNFILA